MKTKGLVESGAAASVIVFEIVKPDYIKDIVTIRIGNQNVEFVIEVTDIFGGDNCKWTVLDKNDGGIVYSGYVSDGRFGEWSATRSITYFQDWLKGKVMSVIKKQIKLR